MALADPSSKKSFAPLGEADPTSARILDGKGMANSIRDGLKDTVASFPKLDATPPSLHVVVAGDNAANRVYAERLQKSGRHLGVSVDIDRLPVEVADEGMVLTLTRLNKDDSVDGIVVALPLPDRFSADIVTTHLDPIKDVDGITVTNAGNLYLGRHGNVPSTAAAIMEILHRAEVEIKGKRAVLVGRSLVVGKPIAHLLLREHATVTICHTRTVDLPAVTREADILVAAAGSPCGINGSMIKPGATVIDAGINVVHGAITGDVDFSSAVEVAGAITPVPGGVGPLTTLLLLTAVVNRALDRAGMVVIC